MRILVSDDVSEKGVAILREHFDVDVKTNMPPEELLACIGEYDGLVTRSQTQVTEEVIAAAHNLKVIGRAGVGVDNINIRQRPPAASSSAMRRKSNTIAAVEHTIGMISLSPATFHRHQVHPGRQVGPQRASLASSCRDARWASSVLVVSAAVWPSACRRLK